MLEALSGDAMLFQAFSTKILPRPVRRSLPDASNDLLHLPFSTFPQCQASDGQITGSMAVMEIQNTRRILAVSLDEQEATLSHVVQGLYSQPHYPIQPKSSLGYVALPVFSPC